MTAPLQGWRRIPVVAVLCMATFLGYGISPSPVMAVVCTASPASIADLGSAESLSALARDGLARDSATCQVSRSRRFGWLPSQTQTFALQDVAIASRLCDNNPRGGVRFCHRVTLLGNRASVTLPDVRTPLTAATLMDSLRNFMAGQGSPQLTWSTPHRLRQWLSTMVLGLLLAIAAWGLWPIQWPPERRSPLALDGDDQA